MNTNTITIDRAPHDEELTVLVCKRDERWYAQGLQRDIAASGKDLDDALYGFSRSLAFQVAIDCEHDVEPLSELSPAPEMFQQMAVDAPRIDKQLPQFTITDGFAPKASDLAARTNVRLCPR